MKKYLVSLALMLFGVLLYAESIDVTYAKGTDQVIIASLYPQPASPEVDANATIEALFTEALNPASTMHSITLKPLSGKKSSWGIFGFGISKSNNKIIKGKTEYDPNTYILRFTPKQPLKVGFYEVKITHLMRMRPGPDMMIQPIRYRFYVPKVINGFKLPPKPDEKKNNETLLGIDFNHNGIRDDVERWIIIHYANDPKYPKTKTAIALQYAWASQKILENPTMESNKYLDDVIDCQYYWLNKKTKGLSGFEFGKFSKEHSVIRSTILDDKIYNNQNRIKQYFKFNTALSGHIFKGREESLNNCRINIDELGE